MKLANLLIIAGMLLIPSHGMARDKTAPDMEMLEFLGSFETAGGKPVDPLGFVDSAAKENKKEQPDAANKDKRHRQRPEKQEQKERDNEK